MVGYRKVQAGAEDDAETVGLHSAGLYKCKASKTSKNELAVLVPSIQDVLNLASHKVPG